MSLSCDQVILDFASCVQLNCQSVGLGLCLRLGFAQVQRVLGQVNLGEGTAISKVKLSSVDEKKLVEICGSKLTC